VANCGTTLAQARLREPFDLPSACYVGPMEDNTAGSPRCSFCDGDQGEVLVAGVRGFICDACVLGEIEVIGAERPQWLAELIATLAHEPSN
jgi:hypothetical protein